MNVQQAQAGDRAERSPSKPLRRVGDSRHASVVSARPRRGAAFAVLFLACLAPAFAAAQPPRDLFAAAQAREREARAAMVAPKTTGPAVLRQIRVAIASYERAATSDRSGSYADAALWSAAELAADAFGAFGIERDRRAAVRLAKSILRDHRDSIYGPKAQAHIVRLDALRFGEPASLIGLQQRVDPAETTITVDLARGVWYRAVRLDGPPRLYIDLYNTRVPEALKGAIVTYRTGAVARLRLGLHPHDTTRIVLEGDEVHGCAPGLASGPARLVLRCRTSAPAQPLPVPDWPQPRSVPPLIPAKWLPSPLPLPALRLTEPTGPVMPSANAGLRRPTSDDEPSQTDAVAVSGASAAGVGGPSLPPPGPGDGNLRAADVARRDVTGTAGPSAADKTAGPPNDSAQRGPSGVPAEPPHDPASDSALEPATASDLDALAATAEGGALLPPRPPLPSRPRLGFTPLPRALPFSRLMPLPGGGPAESLPPPPLLFGEPVSPGLPATRPTVQWTAATQLLAGSGSRIAGMERVQPDLGFQLAVPGSGARRLYADLNVTSRAGRPVVGRGLVRLSGFRSAGLAWSFDAGDTMAAPVTPDFGFSNLFAPPVNLRGVYVAGRSAQTSVTASAARVMARRNIFGTDTLPTGQQLIQAAVSHRPSRALELFGRASDVRGNSPIAFRALVDASREAGGGLRYRPAASWEVVADVGYSAFRRTGSERTDQDVSALVGATWTGTTGWLQVNASRRALGHFAVGSYPYNDRTSLFASGEWGPAERLRLYGGADLARTGLDPDAAGDGWLALPSGTSTRAFGGTRLQFGSWSTIGVRLEGGGRDVRPSKFGGGFATDSGAVSADWNLRVGSANALVRYERRSDVDVGAEGSGFTQQDGSAQLFFSLRSSQLFLQGLLSQQTGRDGSGQSLWQASGGGQVPLGRVYARFEGALGHTRDWATQRMVQRQSLSASATGYIASGTRFSLDVYADRTPDEVPGSSPWALRTMIRVTQSLSFGASRSASLAGAAPYRGPTGRVTGVVFADWNGNGLVDLDEEPVPGVRVAAGPAWVIGGDRGRFALEGVPTGEQTVALDAASVPASFNLPDTPSVTVQVAAKRAVTVDFALVPVGSIHGVVFQDVDGDGVLTAPDSVLDKAVVVLDDGVRTEVTRDGRFWFDSVRIGAHSVSLLLASLPDGAQVGGPATVETTLNRDEPTAEIAFVVTMEKRQEIRKVFAPRKRK